MEKKERIVWIDGLKYFACIGVFLSHFFGTFFFDTAVSDFGLNGTIYSIEKTSSILFNGNFWVMVFCVISGYFSSFKVIDNFKSYLKNIFLRYLRFIFPLFFMSLIILLIENTIGFYSSEFGKLFSNGWLSCFYDTPTNIADILKCTFIFDCRINNVLWTIMPIFIGNLIIYSVKYILNKLKTDTKKVYIAVYIMLSVSFAVCCLMKLTLIYSCACCFGAIIPKLTEYIKKLPIGLCYFLFVFVLFVFHFHNDIVNLLSGVFGFINLIGADYFLLNTVWHFVYAGILILLIFRLELIQNFFENRLFKKLNHTSFSVFIYHCPVIFSFSLLFYKYVSEYLTYTNTVLLDLAATVIILLVFTLLYEKTVGKLCSNIISKIKKSIRI